MNPDLIDKLYENDAVEALAVFNHDGQLTENHLSLNEDTVTQIGGSILGIKSGLQQADRQLKGFVIKTPKYSFIVCFHGTSLVLLQISPGHSLEKTHNNIVSQLGIAASVTAPAGTVQSLGIPKPVQQSNPEPVQEEEVSEPEPATEAGIDYSEFEHELVKILKPIATSVIANKMIKKAIQRSGLTVSAGAQIDIHQAMGIGNDVIEQIPNAKKRKIIQHEYLTMVQKYL